jgi:acyl dehydratase
MSAFVTVETVGYNQHRTTVISFKRTVMVYKTRMRPGHARPGR